MVVEIALGIVLAVVILSLLPLLVAAAGFMIVVGIGLAVVVAAVINWRVTLGIVCGLLVLALALGVPMLLLKYCERRWPQCELLISGKPPYDTIRRAPMRWAAAFAVAVVFASIFVGLLVAGGTAFDYAEKRLRAR